jgi:predicted RNase H-like HicB family nuclease
MPLYSYPVTIEKEGDHYYAYSESFPGVYGLGRTLEGARRSIVKAMRLYIHHCRRARTSVPRSRSVHSETVTFAIE